METCTRPDLSEHLIKALWPKEFPQDRRTIEEHLRECAECRQELAMLQRMVNTIVEHRDELMDCVSECVSMEKLLDVAKGKPLDEISLAHAQACPVCGELVSRIQGLSADALSCHDSSPLTSEEMLLLKDAVTKTYGVFQEKKASVTSRIWSRVLDSLHLPSAVVGAAVAALLIMAVVPHGPAKRPMEMALSGIAWKAPDVMDKSGFQAEPIHPPKRVALLILLGQKTGLSRHDVDALYRELDSPDRFGERFDPIAPSDLKQALAQDATTVSTAQEAATLIFQRTDVALALVWQVRGSGQERSIQGTLFRQGVTAAPMTVSQKGSTTPKDVGNSLLKQAAILLHQEYIE
jgi:hypothetical protein